MAVTNSYHSLADAFNLATSNSSTGSPVINNVSELLTIPGSVAAVYALAPAVSDSRFDNVTINEYNNLNKKLRFNMDPSVAPNQIQSISILQNPSNLGGYSCDDVFGIPHQLHLTAGNNTTYDNMNGINLYPSDVFYLRLGNSKGGYFDNIEILRDNLQSDGTNIRGEECFAFITADSEIGEVIHFHPNGEHYAQREFESPIPTLDGIKVEWYQLRNKKLIPLDFENTVNTLLIDIYHSRDRPCCRY